MYFKKLDIVGFKSFFNRTKLKFEPGVTAVVGPNGCGKSNIVDAIKWVLGEQSAKSMRSSAMQDVIFNGTDKYDPLNMAEVSLTLSNEDRILPVDYDEVIITRRLFRSGDSEYLINKTPVRLADVRGLIMGTGIGTSSYSIVEQGRMDMILSSRPEDRRYIFEEASGITRYKAKKREAMLKLERTNENLVRINDIVREVERQIKSIERQARKAERYKAKYEELKDLEVKLAYRNYSALSTDDSELGTRNDDLRRLSEKLRAGLEEASASLNRQREEYRTLLDDLQGTQNELMRLSSDIDKNAHVIEVDGERIQELRKYAEQLDHEIERTMGRHNVLRVRLEELGTKHSDVSAKRQNKENELISAEEKVKNIAERMEENKHELKVTREKTVDIASDETRTKNMLIRANADIQNLLAREKRLKMERNNVQAERDNVLEDLKAVEEKLRSVTLRLEEKRNEFRAFHDEFAGMQRKLALVNDKKLEKEKKLNEIKPRREFIERLIAEREGIHDSVKEIVKRAEAGDPRFAGVHGILSELVNVRDNYEESVESVLGHMAQAVVVEDRDTAGRVVSFLSENSMGSVSFLILGELKRILKRGASSGIKKGILDDVTHILAAKEPYRSALRALLRDTFVTVSSEVARIFMDGNNDFCGQIVGEKGEIFREGMRRSRNYSAKETIPLFGRREKAEQLRAEEEKITREISSLGAEIKELEEWLREAAVRKEKLETELREMEVDHADVSSRRTSVKEKADALSEELTLLEDEIEEESANIRHLQEEKQRMEEALKELESESERLQNIIDRSQKAIQECSREREETLFRMSDIRAELSAFRKEEENLADNLEREKDSFQRIDDEVGDKRKRIAESNERADALAKEIEDLKERNTAFIVSKEQKEVQISEKKEKKDSLAGIIQREEEEFRKMEQKLEDTRNKTRDSDIMKKELEYKRSSLAERILNVYKVNLAEISMEIDSQADWEEAKANIEELKSQLERMGEVSLGAVEEHKQLEDRFQFLAKQRDDLVSGKESLMQAITKINRTTRKMFMESFEKIQKEFNDYFRMLFSGGKAELILEDESNILECGIDIAVRPPGKKLHNIMQLSGGEKALTATALIFAIFKVNPSPFCILDEIDAPLDESNIVRFCRVLQEFLKLSQFIIVTHNRMTIQLADVLYGITMEEKGVSKIVSVKFTEEAKDSEEETVPTTA